MSPRMDADFDWGGVQVSTPVYPKGDYELTVSGVRGSAWPKKDKAGNPTGEVTEKVAFVVKMVGVYDSKGKLKTEQDGKAIAGKQVEDINLWVHSEGGRRMAKGYMMAVLGYNPREDSAEVVFNKFLKDQKVDLTFKSEENEGGDGYVMTLGSGWEQLFVGKNVRVHMEPEQRERAGADPIMQQNFKSLSPVNG